MKTVKKTIKMIFKKMKKIKLILLKKRQTFFLPQEKLFKQIPNTNIFRILDEIAQCVNTIKNILVYEYNFIGDKLELAVGGFSIGSHYSLFNILQFL